MDEVEAIKAARRALRNVRNGIEAYGASVEAVEAERDARGRRRADFLQSASVRIGTGRPAAQAAERIRDLGLPGPHAAYDRIRPAAEARLAAEDGLGKAEDELRERQAQAIGAGMSADAAQGFFDHMRKSGARSLTEDGVGEALRVSRLAGVPRAWAWLTSPLARQIHGLQRRAAAASPPVDIGPHLERASRLVPLRLTHDARRAEVAEAEGRVQAARAALVRTSQPDATGFRRALLAAMQADARAARLVVQRIPDMVEDWNDLAKHDGHLDRVAILLEDGLERMQTAERWLDRVTGMPSFPDRTLILLQGADRAAAPLERALPLSADSLAPGAIAATLVRLAGETPLPQRLDRREPAAAHGR